MASRAAQLFFAFCFLTVTLNGQVTISGRVYNPTDSIVKLLVSPTVLGGDFHTATALLTADQAFKFSIKSTMAIPAKIMHGSAVFSVFILPGRSFSVDIIIGENNELKLIFDGEGGLDNAHFHRYIQYISVHTPDITIEELAATTAMEYRRLADERRYQKEAFWAELSETVDFSPAPGMMEWIRNDITYNHATELLNYPGKFRQFHRGKRDRHPSDQYYSFLRALQVNNEDVILQDSYRTFLRAFIEYKLEKPISWGLKVGGKKQYPFLRKFLIGQPLYCMQFQILELTMDLEGENTNMDVEYQSFMASDAPSPLKEKLKALKAIREKEQKQKLASIIGRPILFDVFQTIEDQNTDASFFQGKPSLLYFPPGWTSEHAFAVEYMKRIYKRLKAPEQYNLYLVDVNQDPQEWRQNYWANRYETHPFHHLSMDMQRSLFGTKYGNDRFPNMVLLNRDGLVFKKFDLKPNVKKVLEVLNEEL